mgnify:CR=1 FL=1
MDNEFKLKNGSGCLCCKGCGRQDKQLNTYDWLADIPGNTEEQEMVEVQFKNTRKGYYKNSNNTVMVHIRHLREKMNIPTGKSDFIKTVWGVGYKVEE